MQTTDRNLKFTTKDQLRCAAWTFALGVLVIFFGPAEPRTKSLIIGLVAGMSSMWVHVTILRRELHRLLNERTPPSTATEPYTPAT